MWPYWLMFLLPAFAAATERGIGVNPRPPQYKQYWSPGWVAAAAGIALIVGYRLEVGGDWFSYLEYLDLVWGMRLPEVVTLNDPAYLLLNWISVELGFGLVAVNLVGATIFTVGLVIFCRSLPRPWLALTVAVPYLVIVVGMGYSRQGIALALSMIGLVALQKRSIYKFLFWVVVGATFHKTAVLLLPIGALASTQRPILRVFLVGVVSAGAYGLFLAESSEALYAGYIETEYQSEGAMIRLLMNAVPAVILLAWWRRFRDLPDMSSLWLWFAFMSLGLLMVLVGTTASTALDRIALYMLPLQVVVFSYLPDALAGPNRPKRPWVTMIVLYYATVEFVWLNYASHSQYWLPYRFYPLEAFT